MPNRMRPHALCHKLLGPVHKRLASDLSAVLHTQRKVCWHKPATARLYYERIQGWTFLRKVQVICFRLWDEVGEKVNCTLLSLSGYCVQPSHTS